MSCTHCGASNEGTAQFCSSCGRPISLAPVVDQPPTATPTSETPRKARPRWALPAILTAIGVVVVLVGFFIFKSIQPTTHEVMVAISDDPSGGDDCTATSYSAKYIVGTNLTLQLANGDIAGVGTLTGDGVSGAGSCTWVAFMNDVPDSPAYSLKVDGPTVSQSLNYSNADLVAKNWNIALSKNF